MKNDLIAEIIEITKLDKKDLIATYAKLGEETGELAREILSYINEPSTLHRYSTKSDIIEECIDTALVAISIAIKAGADSEEINKMFRLKLDKWASILQNEGRLKDISNIPFEIHCTIDTTDKKLEEISNVCNIAKVKLISLELTNRRNEKIPDVMTSSKFFGTNSEAIEETQRIINILAEHNIKVIRAKVETVPWHPLAPQTKDAAMPTGCYFEAHVGILLPLNIPATAIDRLKRMCDLHDAHYSRNIFKTSEINKVQMVTIREYRNYEYFNNKLNQFKQDLLIAGFEYEKVISEFALYDTNIHHDASWLN